MNMLIGIIAGTLTGWLAFSRVDASQDLGLGPCLFIGAVGGALGVLAMPLVTSANSEGPVSIALLVLALAGAGGSLFVSNIVARRLGR